MIKKKFELVKLLSSVRLVSLRARTFNRSVTSLIRDHVREIGDKKTGRTGLKRNNIG